MVNLISDFYSILFILYDCLRVTIILLKNKLLVYQIRLSPELIPIDCKYWVAFSNFLRLYPTIVVNRDRKYG
jgi:hypothetical protein